jgi:hypothetical protein
MISLFEQPPQAAPRRLRIPVKMVLGNVAAAAVSALAAFIWFAVAFAVGDVPSSASPIPAELFLLASVLAVVALGAVLDSVLKHFPWLAILMTPLLLFAIMSLSFGRDGRIISPRLGACISGLYVFGALIRRGVRLWMQRTGGRQASR